MNKILIVLIILVAGVGVAISIVFFLLIQPAKTPSQNTPSGSNNLPSSNPSTVVPNTGTNTATQNDSMLSVAASDGSTLQIKNIKKDPSLKADTANPGYYYFKQGLATSSQRFTIGYIDKTQYFNIVLHEEPLGLVREEVQAYLVEHLGVTQTELCRLNYMVSVPYSVNQDFSSMNLGFSPCPGAAAL